jgi:hypothetical protein
MGHPYEQGFDLKPGDGQTRTSFLDHKRLPPGFGVSLEASSEIHR